MDYRRRFTCKFITRGIPNFYLVALTLEGMFGIFTVPNDLCGEGTLLLGNC